MKKSEVLSMTRHALISCAVLTVVGMSSVGTARADTVVQQHDQDAEYQENGGSAGAALSSKAEEGDEGRPASELGQRGAGAVEEIVVSAQLRTERLQDVPISVQVLSGDVLAEQNVNSLIEVGSLVPSVFIDRAGRTNLMSIRGVASGSTTSFDQSVGVFVDGIYHGRSRSTAATFLDMERMEILKGPQTTYFGNNAIAGAFNIKTRTPGDTFEGSARATYGQYGQYAAEVAMGGPTSDDVGVRAAVTYNGQDGWIENINTGRKQPYEQNIGGRVIFAYAPSDVFDATLKVEASKNESSGIYLQIDNCPPPEPFPTQGFCAQALELGVPIGVDNDLNSESAGQNGDLDGSEAVLTMNYRLWGHTLTSLSGYYEYDYQQNFDLDGLPIDGFHAAAPESYYQASQEFRIASETGGTIEYLAGIYFQSDRLRSYTDQIFFFLSPAFSAIAPDLEPYAPLAQNTGFTQDETISSVFGSVTWNATEHLRLTAGLRGSWVEKEFNWFLFYGTATDRWGDVQLLPSPELQETAAMLGFGTPGTIEGLTRRDNRWMPSLGLQYKIDGDVMVYATYTNGFKAGGFNGNYPASTGIVPSEAAFGPERVDAFEAGIKSAWFDRRLTVNVAAFHSRYDGLQVSRATQSPGGAQINIVDNAASAISQGLELEASWSVTDQLRVAVAASYIDSYYEKYPEAPLSQLQNFCRGVLANSDSTAYEFCIQRFPPSSYPTGIGTTQDLSGTQQLRAPKWSGSFSATHLASLPGGYALTTQLTTYYSDDYYQNLLDEWVGAYTKVDARFSVETPSGNWAFELIGRNLTDKQTYSFYAGQPRSANVEFKQRDLPRSIAAQIRYAW